MAISEKRDDSDEKRFHSDIAELVSRHLRSSIGQISVGRIMMHINRVAADRDTR